MWGALLFLLVAAAAANHTCVRDADCEWARGAWMTSNCQLQCVDTRCYIVCAYSVSSSGPVAVVPLNATPFIGRPSSNGQTLIASLMLLYFVLLAGV